MKIPCTRSGGCPVRTRFPWLPIGLGLVGGSFFAAVIRLPHSPTTSICRSQRAGPNDAAVPTIEVADWPTSHPMA